VRAFCAKQSPRARRLLPFDFAPRKRIGTSQDRRREEHPPRNDEISGRIMTEVSLAEWNRFLEGHPNAHILQTGEWGELKGGFGWDAVRIVSGDVGIQVLFRKLPLGFTIAYAPKPVLPRSNDFSRSGTTDPTGALRGVVTTWDVNPRSNDLSRSRTTDPTGALRGVVTTWGEDFWKEVDAVCRKRRAVFLKIEPDLWEDVNSIELRNTHFPSQHPTSPHHHR